MWDYVRRLKTSAEGSVSRMTEKFGLLLILLIVGCLGILFNSCSNIAQVCIKANKCWNIGSCTDCSVMK